MVINNYLLSENMVEQVALATETRDELLSECDGISQLVEWLDTIDRRPGLGELEQKLNSIQLNYLETPGGTVAVNSDTGQPYHILSRYNKTN